MVVINCDIYISFKVICWIQERIFRDGRTGFGWENGTPFWQQDDRVRYYVIGMMSSTKMLEAWSKTPEGTLHRRNMELAVEGKLSEVDGDSPADVLLRRCDYPSWKGALGLDTGFWLTQLNQRFQ